MFFSFGVFKNTDEEYILLLFWDWAYVSIVLCFYFFLDFVFIGALGGLYEEICEGLMIRGEYIWCDVSACFHLWVVALMHGAFDAHVDKAVCDFWVFPEVIDPNFHVGFDFDVYSLQV